MLTLTRQGNDIFYNDTKLTINKQASKGKGNEVVKIEGLPEANGAKWISLSRVKEGTHDYEVQGRIVTSTGSYTLTPEEKAEVDKLQARIDEIKSAAKARHTPKFKFLSNFEFNALTKEQQDDYADRLESYIEALKNGQRLK